MKKVDYKTIIVNKISSLIEQQNIYLCMEKKV